MRERKRRRIEEILRDEILSQRPIWANAITATGNGVVLAQQLAAALEGAGYELKAVPEGTGNRSESP